MTDAERAARYKMALEAIVAGVRDSEKWGLLKIAQAALGTTSNDS